MPSPRRTIVLFLLFGFALGLLPPAVGAPPRTLVATEHLGLPAVLTAKRTTWTREVRACAPFSFSMVGLVWDQGGDAEVTADVAGVRVHADPHDGPDPSSVEGRRARQGTPPVWTGERRCATFRIRVPARQVLRGVRAVFIDPSGTPEPSLIGAVGTAMARLWGMREAAALTKQPGMVTREQWGADESIRACGPFYAPEVKVAYVHHTATSNAYSRTKADDIMRGIYAYHVKGRNFCDIAYNFLVDKYGVTYEGRYGGIDQPLIGGHAMGFNTGSTGIAAIGNFVKVDPPTAMVRAIRRLLAWRLDVAHVQPDGWASMTSGGGSNQKYDEGEDVLLRTVIPHRRTGYTTCPGRLVKFIGKIRTIATNLGQPKIYRIRSSSPDVVQGVTSAQLTATNTEAMSWTVEIRDAVGGLVRTFTGTGTAVDAMWDGKGADGVTSVAPGDYTANVAAQAGSRVARAGAITLRVCGPDPANPTATTCPEPAAP